MNDHAFGLLLELSPPKAEPLGVVKRLQEAKQKVADLRHELANVEVMLCPACQVRLAELRRQRGGA